MSIRRLIAALLLPTVVAAQTITIPVGYASTEGNAGNALPWSINEVAVQCLYAASNFTQQGVVSPITITRLRWRANGGIPRWGAVQCTAATVRMATARLPATAPSRVFAANTERDATTVHSGPLQFAGSRAAEGATGSDVVDLALAPPFRYDPALGDLVIEVGYAPGSWLGGGRPPVDVVDTGVACSRVASVTAGAATGAVDLDFGVVVTVDYVPTPGTTRFGTGCREEFASMYEFFAASAAFDLANSSFTMLPLAGGYRVQPGLAAFVPPSAAATVLPLGDNSQVVVNLSARFPTSTFETDRLVVCSNGFVSADTGNGTPSEPSVDYMLAAPSTAWWNWHHYDPARPGGGRVRFEEVGALACVTWDGVADATAAGDPNTFQLQFEEGTGRVHFVFAAMSAAGNARLVGYSPGGPSMRPDATDLSAAVPATFVLPAVDVAALFVDTAVRPTLGAAVPVVTSSFAVGTPLVGTAFALARLDPGIELAPLGAPGCRQYLLGASSVLSIAPFGPVTVVLSIPDLPAFAGQTVFVQSAVLAPGRNALGVLTSNGLALQVTAH